MKSNFHEFPQESKPEISPKISPSAPRTRIPVPGSLTQAAMQPLPEQRLPPRSPENGPSNLPSSETLQHQTNPRHYRRRAQEPRTSRWTSKLALQHTQRPLHTRISRRINSTSAAIFPNHPLLSARCECAKPLHDKAPPDHDGHECLIFPILPLLTHPASDSWSPPPQPRQGQAPACIWRGGHVLPAGEAPRRGAGLPKRTRPRGRMVTSRVVPSFISNRVRRSCQVPPARPARAHLGPGFDALH
jgi:hypothetical protein